VKHGESGGLVTGGNVALQELVRTSVAGLGMEPLSAAYAGVVAAAAAKPNASEPAETEAVRGKPLDVDPPPSAAQRAEARPATDQPAAPERELPWSWVLGVLALVAVAFGAARRVGASA
jgi:hypothetical protein